MNDAHDDPERTRRIQEDIRRKIAERRAGRQPPIITSAPSERPVAPPVLAPRPAASSGGGLREKLQKKLQELQQKAEAAQRARDQAEALRREQALNPPVIERRPAPPPVVETPPAIRDVIKETKLTSTPLPRSPWRAALRNPASLRQAIVLREILGPPVGLR